MTQILPTGLASVKSNVELVMLINSSGQSIDTFGSGGGGGGGTGITALNGQIGPTVNLVAGFDIALTTGTNTITIAYTGAQGINLTVPSTTTNLGIVGWSGTSGGGLLNSLATVSSIGAITTPAWISTSGINSSGSITINPNDMLNIELPSTTGSQFNVFDNTIIGGYTAISVQGSGSNTIYFGEPTVALSNPTGIFV